MTYKENIENLRKETTKTLGEYHKAEDELAGEGGNGGFIDKIYFDNVQSKHTKWQEATNKYNSFLSFIVRNGIDMNSEISNN